MHQVLEIQAVGPGVVFGDELRRGYFQQHKQHPPDAIPPCRGAGGPGAVPEPRRQHGRQGQDQGQQAQVHAQAAEHDGAQAAGGLDAFPLPGGQAQPAECQQNQDGDRETYGQPAHGFLVGGGRARASSASLQKTRKHTCWASNRCQIFVAKIVHQMDECNPDQVKRSTNRVPRAGPSRSESTESCQPCMSHTRLAMASPRPRGNSFEPLSALSRNRPL